MAQTPAPVKTASPASDADALLQQLEESAARDEATLRMQSPDEGLGEPAETQLALLKAQSNPVLRTLRTWAYVKHLFWALSEGLSKESDGKREAAHELLSREPVEVRLESGRLVRVTGRSYSCLYEIARHAIRLQEIEQELSRAAELSARSIEAIATSRTRRARSLHLRRYRRLSEIQQLGYGEAADHRRAIYAHAFTRDGAPAVSLDDVPAWADELTPDDDARLLAAVWEAGAGRYARIGVAPERDGKREPAENLGWHSMFSSLERHLKVAPASLRNQDLFHLLTWLRAGADAPDEETGDLDE